MKVNYLLKLMVAVAFMFTAVMVQAQNQITVVGNDRAAFNAAFSAAVAGDEILITESIIWDGSANFGLNKRVIIKGVGEGIEIKAAPDFKANMFDLYGNGDGEKLVLENLTFVGNPDSTDRAWSDAGILRVLQGQVEIKNCIFKDGYTQNRGGAVFIDSGDGTAAASALNVTFIDCVFSNNTSFFQGGAVFANVRQTNAANGSVDQYVTFVNCVFENNQNLANRGSAIVMQGGAPGGIFKLYNCVIKENQGGVGFWSGTAWERPYLPDPRPADNATRRGEGGTIVADGGANIRIESSSIVNNVMNSDHGGAMFIMTNPNVTLINTTVADNVMNHDANSMIFVANGANPTLSLINTTFAGNKAGEHSGPGNGNSTGIAFLDNSTLAKLIIHNSIVVGNTALDGTPHDVKIGGANATMQIDIQNSIIGAISGRSENAIGAISSLINFYERTDNLETWRSKDASGISWGKGLVTADNGQIYYALEPTAQAISRGNAALLKPFVDPLVDQIGNPRGDDKIAVGAVEFIEAPAFCLDLDNLTMNANLYDAATRTITYTSAWQFVGWEWGTQTSADDKLDVSAYNYVDVTFNLGGLTGATSVEVCVSYLNGQANGDWITNVTVAPGVQTVRIPIGKGNRGGGAFVPEFATDAAKVWRIGTKNSGTGTVVLESFCFGYKMPLTYSLDELNFFATDAGEDATAASYDPETTTATYNKAWARAGWNFEPDGGLNIFEYNQIFLVIGASDLRRPDVDGAPGEAVLPANAKIQFDVEYMDGTKETSTTNQYGNEYRANADTLMWNLTKHKTQKIKLVTLKSEFLGDIQLEEAYLYFKETPPVDLIVESIRWEPEKPAPGEAVKLFATIKNISDETSPNTEKHGAIFQINGTTVAWSDTFMGPLAPGESKELEANGGPGTGNTGTWAPGNDFSYAFRVQVNDSKNIIEEDAEGNPAYDNNWSDTEEIFIDGDVDLQVVGITFDWPTSDMNDEPQVGDAITFTARVINTGSLNSPKGVKHGVAFKVNGTVVSWSDTYFESIPRGTQQTATRVPLTANGGPNGGDGTWTPTTGGGFTVVAEVNDQKEIPESDYTNNTFERVVTIVSIDGIAGEEAYVYVENGTLYIVGYAADAKVEIFNVAGQKVASVVNGQTIQLNAGAYLVQITEKGRATVQKVLVK